MKRKKQIYKRITDLNIIMDMYDNVIRKNTKNKQKIEEFENFYSQNMVEIKDVLASKKYVPNNFSYFFFSHMIVFDVSLSLMIPLETKYKKE